MRAIFMIPTKPPPSFREPDRWSPEFIDFVSLCLVKNPEERATATDLLQHEFIRNAKPNSILSNMIAEAKEIRENQSYTRAAAIQQANKQLQSQNDDSDDENSGTMKKNDFDCGTLVPSKDDEGELTMIAHTDCGTLVPDNGTMIELQSNLGTMVINSDSEESTMKRHDTNPDKPKYRPLFLDHFDKKEAEGNVLANSIILHEDGLQEVPKMQVPAKNTPQQIQQQLMNAPPPAAQTSATQMPDQEMQDHQMAKLQQQLQQQHLLNQAHAQQMPIASAPTDIGENLQHQFQQQQQQQQQPQYQPADNILKYRTLDCDYEFVSFYLISLLYFNLRIIYVFLFFS